MMLTRAMPSTVSDFPFIAHDAQNKTKRQIPTFVRAHVMERYHRERRAKSGVKDTTNPVWSQHEFVAATPVGRGGQILKWDNGDKKSSSVKSVRGKAERGGKKIKRSSPKAEEPGEDVEEIIKKRSNSPKVKLEEFDDIEFRTSWDTKMRILRNQMTSLMPKNDFEEGGMKMLQVLDGYYGAFAVGRNQLDPWHNLWNFFAFSDPCLFHASLAKFAIHFAAARGGFENSPELLRHKGIAIAQLSKRIADTSVQPTDQMIASAVCLVGTELYNPDHTALKLHIRGARRMIAMRGGLDRIEISPILVSGYLGYEYVLAMVDDDLRDTTFLETIQMPDLHALVFPARSSIFTLSRKSVDPTVYGYSHDTVALLRILCTHLAVSDAFSTKLEPFRSLDSLMMGFDQLDLKLASQVDSGSDTEGSTLSDLSGVDHVLQALLLAVSLQFPYFPTTARIALSSHQERLKQLQYHILNSPHRTYWRPIPGALLWCLYVATVYSKGFPERSFFLANMIRSTVGVAFNNIEAVRIALATFYQLAKEQRDRERWAVIE